MIELVSVRAGHATRCYQTSGFDGVRFCSERRDCLNNALGKSRELVTTPGLQHSAHVFKASPHLSDSSALSEAGSAGARQICPQ